MMKKTNISSFSTFLLFTEKLDRFFGTLKKKQIIKHGPSNHCVLSKRSQKFLFFFNEKTKLIFLRYDLIRWTPREKCQKLEKGKKLKKKILFFFSNFEFTAEFEMKKISCKRLFERSIFASGNIFKKNKKNCSKFFWE